jgi:multidrug transporter EmrE-like cation transporter
MIIYYIYLAIAITCTAFGQFYYKKYFISRKSAYMLLALALFIPIPAFTYLALGRLSIDLVYISTSITILMVMLLSRFALNEKSSPRHWLGCLLIVLGVIAYAV